MITLVKQFIYLIVLSVCFANFNSAQTIRTTAMGGLTYSIKDKDYSINAYDLAANPAWLINDEINDYLEITPSISSKWGDYRRKYDPEKSNFYGLLFEGVKVLDSTGTFLGQTTYEYDYRSNVYRSLKYNTYNGEAFFMNDTTVGNFRYNGPSMRFMYSFKPINDFFVGATAKYKILDGLKSIYSRAQTLYRSIAGDVGLAYNISPAFTAGIKFAFNDEQEKIEAASEDLLDVEIYNFKGETFSVRNRSGSVNQKIHNLSKSISAQLFIKPSNNTEAALLGNVERRSEEILIPYTSSATNERFQEYEDGYASFNVYDFKIIIRHNFSEEFMLSGKASYNENNSWSKNSPIDLLLWKWNVKDINAGVGSSYYIANDFLLGAEYELSFIKIDSAKYADSRYNVIKATTHAAKIGTEYMIFENTFLRLGYNFEVFDESENSLGESTVTYHKVTAGTGIKIFDTFSIDAQLEYQQASKEVNTVLKRSSLSGVITLTLFSF